MTLTGLESPSDLELLHYVATAGEIDNEISMVKFGKPARLTMQFLMRIGHPIDEVSVARSRMHQRRWRWNPPPSESSCRRTQET